MRFLDFSLRRSIDLPQLLAVKAVLQGCDYLFLGTSAVQRLCDSQALHISL